jgi:hypothetical protein
MSEINYFKVLLLYKMMWWMMLDRCWRCDRTTSEIRGLSSRIQIGWFSTKREYSKHTYKAKKTMISLKIKLLQLSFKVYKIEKQKNASKDETICGNVELDVIRVFTSP